MAPNNTSQVSSACGAKVRKTLGVRVRPMRVVALRSIGTKTLLRNILERAWAYGQGQMERNAASRRRAPRSCLLQLTECFTKSD